MKLLIVPCNHWIGYHITNTLVENDFQLDCLIDSTIDHDLSMFFGRNSQINLIDKIEKKYEVCIVIGEYEQIHSLKSRKTIIIETDKTLKSIEESTTIVRPPYLFGEWMPMDENGFYVRGQYIPFDSDVFRNNALFIDQFTSLFVQWIKATKLPKYLEVNLSNQKSKGNAIYVRETGEMKKQLERVQRHYRKYRNFYQ